MIGNGGGTRYGGYTCHQVTVKAVLKVMNIQGGRGQVLNPEPDRVYELLKVEDGRVNIPSDNCNYSWPDFKFEIEVDAPWNRS